MNNKKILMLAPYSIREMDGAPRVRAYNMYHALADITTTTLIFEEFLYKPSLPRYIWTLRGDSHFNSVRSQIGIWNWLLSTHGRMLPELLQLIKKNQIRCIYIEALASSLLKFDYGFLNIFKRKNIPIFPYIRDLYWMYWKYPRTLTPPSRDTKIRFKRMEREMNWYLENATALLFPTKTMADVFDFPEKYLLPPAGDTSRCLRPELPQNKNIVFVGGFTHEKINVLLEAMEYVIKEHPDAHCTIVGYTKDLAIVNKWEHKKWLHFTTGSYWDLPRIMADAYIAALPWSTVSPHNNITIPFKLFDYMSFGRPIVATNCKETAKFITENKVGIVTDGIPEDFAAGIIELLDDRELAQGIGQNALSLIEKKHSWKHRARELISIMGTY